MYLVLFIISCLVLILSFITNYNLWVGTLIGIIGGISAYIYKKTSFTFAKKHSASALEIMMTRFIPIIILMSIKIDIQSVFNLFVHFKVVVLFFALVSFIIPTYLSQYSTNHLGAEQSSIISALIFPLCWFGDLILHHGNINTIKITDLIIAITAFFIITYPYIMKMIRTNHY